MKSLKPTVGVWLLWRLLGPEVPPRYRTAQEHPLRIPGRSVFVGEHELFVRETGPEKGPPLVLIHGWGLDSLTAWHRLIPGLEQAFRIVSIDQRNKGKSDRIRERYDIARVADEIAAVMDALGIDRSAVAGYSMGGMVAQELAHRYPHRVTKLVLIATLSHHRPAARAIRSLIGFGGRALERVSRTEVGWVWWRYLLAVGAVDERHARWLWESRLDRDPYLAYEALFAILRFDSRRWLGGLDVPTLVIAPSRDQLIPMAWQADLAARIANARLVQVAGARHEAPMTHPAQVGEAMRLFLTGRPDRPTA